MGGRAARRRAAARAARVGRPAGGAAAGARGAQEGRVCRRAAATAAAAAARWAGWGGLGRQHHGMRMPVDTTQQRRAPAGFRMQQFKRPPDSQHLATPFPWLLTAVLAAPGRRPGPAKRRPGSAPAKRRGRTGAAPPPPPRRASDASGGQGDGGWAAGVEREVALQLEEEALLERCAAGEGGGKGGGCSAFLNAWACWGGGGGRGLQGLLERLGLRGRCSSTAAQSQGAGPATCRCAAARALASSRGLAADDELAGGINVLCAAPPATQAEAPRVARAARGGRGRRA